MVPPLHLRKALRELARISPQAHKRQPHGPAEKDNQAGHAPLACLEDMPLPSKLTILAIGDGPLFCPADSEKASEHQQTWSLEPTRLTLQIQALWVW